MNRLPEEATCKNCPHWERHGNDNVGDCMGPDNTKSEGGLTWYSKIFMVGENCGCSRHPYWSKEE